MSDPSTATSKSSNKYAVLYVDDEEQALKYFRKAIEKEFPVFTAPSVKDATEILDREGAKIGVVITDQRMPGAQGTDLLADVRKRFPAIVRILTTAYAEIDDAIKAVNAGAIYKYLTKPVDLAVMKETIQSAMQQFVSQGERDSLLQIKMSALRRMVVADRVGSLAGMAYGLVNYIRNSLTATYCFLDEADPSQSPAGSASGGSKESQQLWQLASEERARLLEMLEELQRSTRDPQVKFQDQVDAEQLIRRAATSAAAAIQPRAMVSEIASGLGVVRVDPDQVVRAVEILAGYLARHCKPEGKVSIIVKSAVPMSNTTALQVLLTCEGDAWTEKDVATLFVPFAFPESDPQERGLGLVSAFSVAHQHGGDILVHRSGATGPGFELLLPTGPVNVAHPELQEDLLQMVLR